MKLRILLITLTLSTTSFANADKKPVDRYDLQLSTLKGEIILYYDNGTIKSRMPLVKGVRNGKANSYHPDGSIRAETYYVNGKINGVSKGWYDSGILRGEEAIKNGVRHGYRKSYYESGAKKEVVLYEDGNPIDIRMYNEDGTVFYSKDYR